jgi:hypothetical protein
MLVQNSVYVFLVSFNVLFIAWVARDARFWLTATSSQSGSNNQNGAVESLPGPN